MKRVVMLTLLGLLLAGVTLGSLLMAPSRAQNRFQPIPVHAHLVYDNENPDWFLSFFPGIGKTSDDFSKVWKKNLQELENYPLAVATVPFSGREGRNAWVAVSQLGGPAALALRWRLLLSPPDGVAVSRPYAAWPVWTFEHPSLPSRARVRFTLTDGLWICSFSTDSHDIYRLIDTFDGRAASLADRRTP